MSKAGIFVLRMDTRKAEGVRTGVGHYTTAIFSELDKISSVVPLRGSGAAWHLKQAIKARISGDVYFSPESLIAPTLIGRRAMLTIHDLTPLTHPDRHTAWNRLVHKLFLRIAIRRAGAVIVPTAAVRNDVAKFFPTELAKTHVVHEGVRFSPRGLVTPIRARERVVIYLGTIEPRKNVSVLCRAVAGLNSSLPESARWQLVLIGKRGWLSEAQVDELERDIADSAALELGYLPDESVHEWLSRATLFVYPSEAEGFGLPPLEAMAAGAPVIVTDDEALMEVVGLAAEVVPRGAQLESALLSVMQRVLFDDAKLEELQRAGLARTSEFSWRRAAESTLAIAERLRPS